jgi:glycosyl transferase family 25
MLQNQSSHPSIPAFYINLNRDVFRRARIEEELANSRIQAERIPAIEGRAVPDWLQSFYDDRLGPGEVGCSASHLTICRIIIERDLPFALILEDDARIEKDCRGAIEIAVKLAPRGWDIIRLIESSSRPFQQLGVIDPGRSLVRYLRVPRSTTGLVVSQSGARKLLTPRLVKEPIDVEIRWPWQLDLDVYGIHPPPVTQASGVEVETTIPTRSRPKKRNQLRRMIFNIRKMGLASYLACFFARDCKPTPQSEDFYARSHTISAAGRPTRTVGRQNFGC